MELAPPRPLLALRSDWSETSKTRDPASPSVAPRGGDRRFTPDARHASGISAQSMWSSVLMAVFGAMTLAGCVTAPVDTGRPEPGTPARSSPAAVSTGDIEVEVLRVYRGMWRAYVAATRTADPDHLGLARYVTGDALRVLQSGLQRIRKQGLRGRGQVVVNPTVDKLTPASDPTVAVVGDCVDTSGSQLYRADGARYQDSPGGSRACSATVREVAGGVWKVSGFGLRAVGTCS